mgnify:CR=1 FL=1
MTVTRKRINCPRCGGYGKIAMVIDWQTCAEPCPRCNEKGKVSVSSLTPRERATWLQRERRKAQRKAKKAVK